MTAKNYCATCSNTGMVNCYCGGDTCACGDEELICPDCNGGIVCDTGDDYPFDYPGFPA